MLLPCVIPYQKILVSQPPTPVNGRDERQAAIDRGRRLRFVCYQGVTAAGWLSPLHKISVSYLRQRQTGI